MELKKQQVAAYNAILSFLNDKSKSVFILKGYAGTGKTTLVSSLVEYLIGRKFPFYLMAPTGKAAKVLSAKTGKNATTIHRGIYESAVVEIKNAERVNDIEVVYKFPIRKDGFINKICIVDEASMISSVDSADIVFRFGSGNIMRDLVEFADTYHGGKLIFVGDPAQLPPVGDKNSEALREEFFTEQGYYVDCFELTDVLRQDCDSLILQNALKVREILRLHKSNSIDFETNDSEFAEVEKKNLLDMYCTDANGVENGESVLLTYSNAEAAQFNAYIRSKLIGKEELQSGETLMVVNNNYHLNEWGDTLMNGNIVKTLDVSPNVEIINSFANIYEGESRKIIPVSLRFRNVSIADEESNVYNCKIIDSLLQSDKPSLTYLERQALYINFIKNHSELKVGSVEFIDAWRKDPYVNAVQVKYGYAITVHKSQGSEWSRVYLNYRNANTSEECLRWIYTATTRAAKAVIACNVPHIKPTSKIRVAEVVALKHIPEGWGQGCFSNKQISAYKCDVTPFHSVETNEALRRKYWQVASALEGTSYKIESVQQKPYREIYIINGERFDTCYSGKFVFRDFMAAGSSEASTKILKLINAHAVSAGVVEDSVEMDDYSYVPSEGVFQMIWDILKPMFQQSGVAVESVVENKEQFYVQYNILTSGSFACLKVYFNDKQFITYIVPGSNIGLSDKKLKKVIDVLVDL